MLVKYQHPLDAAALFHARCLVRFFMRPITASCAGPADDCTLPLVVSRAHVQRVQEAMAQDAAARDLVASQITIAVGVPIRRVFEVLCNAVDSGSFGYWIRRGSFHAEVPIGFRPSQLAWLERSECDLWPGYFAPLVPGGRWSFDTIDGDKCRIEIENIVHALGDMQSKHARHFADLVGEDDDADTADVLVQLAALGEVTYG